MRARYVANSFPLSLDTLGDHMATTATESTTNQTPEPTRPAPAGVTPIPRATRLTFTPEQRDLIRVQCCTDASDASNTATESEFAAFMATCERLQLDPLARQIHFLKRGAQGKKTGRAEVSIDGFRLIAERTGEYCGQTPREWADVAINANQANITWYEVWPFKTRDPLAARVGVYRRGFAEPLFAVARFDAYKQTKYSGELNAMWAKMGPEQLGKCAEALALRQAFPNELSGVYTPDEMDQSDEPTPDVGRAANVAQRGAQAQRAAAPAAQRPAQAKPPRAPHPLAVPPKDRAELAAAGIALFPYGGLQGVPLVAKWPAEGGGTPQTQAGTYVVSDEKLEEAERKASELLARYRSESAPAEKIAELETALGQLADEMTRRTDERDAAASQDVGGGYGG